MDLHNPSNFENYRYLTIEKPITIELTIDQQAVVLKTYDYGINTLTEIEERLLDAVVSNLKEAINP